MSTIKILRVITLTACSVLSAQADPASPNNYNCLQRIEQWQPINGKWSVQNGSRWLIENGSLRVERPSSDSRLLFTDPDAHPRWYSLRLTISGFSRANEKTVGIILGYTDAQNYYVCTFLHIDDHRATISLARIRDGREESKSTVPLEHRAEDTEKISVQVYAAGAFRVSVHVDNRECLKHEENTAQPTSFGVTLPSDGLSVTSCIIQGIAKK